MKIKSDSRKINEGDTFIALKTINNDGHKYIDEVISNGAKKIIAQHGKYSVETLIVEDTRKYLKDYLNKYYKYIFEKIKLIGITGTNGKTTTAYLIHQAMNKLNIKCGYIGTIGFYIDEKIMDLPNTTPDILDIYELLIIAYEEGCDYVVMETSSQGIDQGRIEGLFFDYAIFTNLTNDHLDYHHTMSNYLSCKQKLFNQIKKDGLAIINSDDEEAERFLFNNNNITYGFDCGDFQITSYNFDNTCNFIVNNEHNYSMNIMGKYNIYNVLVVIIILEKIGINKTYIKDTIASLTPPKGRMDIVNYNDCKIIVDYAHTPDAVLNIITAVKEMTSGKIITIIGCGGDRDSEKRPQMGEISLQLSDFVIFTSDNPRYENPIDIINDMINNTEKENYEVTIDRKAAIKRGVQKLKKNDILLILGKGHETYQIIKNEKNHFDDLEEVLNIIRR